MTTISLPASSPETAADHSAVDDMNDPASAVPTAPPEASISDHPTEPFVVAEDVQADDLPAVEQAMDEAAEAIDNEAGHIDRSTDDGVTVPYPAADELASETAEAEPTAPEPAEAATEETGEPEATEDCGPDTVATWDGPGPDPVNARKLAAAQDALTEAVLDRAQAEADLEAAKAAVKEAKEVEDSAIKAMEWIRSNADGNGNGEPYTGYDDSQAASGGSNGDPLDPAIEPPEEPSKLAPDAWKAVPVSILAECGLSQATCKHLVKQGKTTLGSLQTGEYGGDYTQIKGIGQAKSEKIMDAFEEFWKKHPQFVVDEEATAPTTSTNPPEEDDDNATAGTDTEAEEADKVEEADGKEVASDESDEEEAEEEADGEAEDDEEEIPDEEDAAFDDEEEDEDAEEGEWAADEEAEEDFDEEEYEEGEYEENFEGYEGEVDEEYEDDEDEGNEDEDDEDEIDDSEEENEEAHT